MNNSQKTALILSGVSLISGIAIFSYFLKCYLDKSKSTQNKIQKVELLRKEDLIEILKEIKNTSQPKVEQLIKQNRKIRRSMNLSSIEEYDKIIEKNQTFNNKEN